MYGTIVSGALLGLSAVASARPLFPVVGTTNTTSSFPAFRSGVSGPLSTGVPSGPTGPTGPTTNSFHTDFHGSSGAEKDSVGVVGEVVHGEFVFENEKNVFPNIVNPSEQLDEIEKVALGQLPNGSPPVTPHSDSITSLGFIAFNELFEVAFFTELIANITNNVPGYDRIPNRDEVLGVLEVVQAQEELHELNANGAFTKLTGAPIQPCKYDFPVDNFKDAIALASKFTDVVLATLPDIQTLFAEAGDADLIRGVGAVIGQEGEQNGFYREILHKNPSQLPFLTGGARDFAFSAILQNFAVPGSCPSEELLIQRGLKEFNVLNVLTDNLSINEDVEAHFSVQIAPDHQSGGEKFSQHNYKSQYEGKFVTYINQQNVPISFPIKDLSFDISDFSIHFKAEFPGKSHDLNGLTIAAVTSVGKGFTDPDSVADKTVAGPGLIEIN